MKPSEWSAAQKAEYDLGDRVRGPTEPMLDYYEDIQKRLLAAYPGRTEREVGRIGVEVFLDGLQDAGLVKAARKHRPKDCSEAYRWASEAEGQVVFEATKSKEDEDSKERHKGLKQFLDAGRSKSAIDAELEAESDRTQRFADTQPTSPSKGTELTDVTDIFQYSDEEKEWWENDAPELEASLKDMSLSEVAPGQPPAYETAVASQASIQDQVEGGLTRRGAPRPPVARERRGRMLPSIPALDGRCLRRIAGRCACGPEGVEAAEDESSENDEVEIVFVGEDPTQGMFPENARFRGHDWIQEGRASRLKLIQFKTRYLEGMVERLVGGQEHDYDRIVRLGDRVQQLEATAVRIERQHRRGFGPSYGRSNLVQRAWPAVDGRDTCGSCHRRGHIRAHCYGIPVFPARRPRVPVGMGGRYYLHENRGQCRPGRARRC